MSVICIRVPKELKEEMKEIDINWSEYIRDLIRKKIRQIKMMEASKKIDEIRAKTVQGKFNAAKSIREDRDSL
ncbi:MAG: hypothetical protein DRJ34_04360 [Thermoprotei archaeon]|nr:MAG: hypothetical protein DRJ34_04360 [Thermoprotei archaeon]